MAGLTFAGVRKDYGDVPALRGLDLEVADGEFMVVVGPSGCGKSTALRTAAGLEEPTAGSISIGGRDVTTLPPAARNVAMVFQSYALFPHLTVSENVGFGLAARRVAKDEIAGRVRAAAEVVGCSDLLARKPYELSGGERQRVALARALVREPDVFLLDEPLSNLDAQLRVQMRAELKRLHQRLGATMVYVTHDQLEALTMGDRVAVLRDGRVQQVGAPDEVYRRPSNRFVAGFIGSPAMNVFAVVDGRAGPFPVTPPSTGAHEAGVRPEHVRVSVDGEGTPAEVQVVEVAGNETFLHLAAEGRRVVARVGPDLRPPVGSVVRVSAAAADVYFFDAESGATVSRQSAAGPPSVTLVAPRRRAVVRGSVSLVAETSTGAAVRYFVSDGSADWQPLPGDLWDTTLVADGVYWLSAIATNGAGHSAASDPLPVLVANR
jgi:ABC-type sugar transport system ATPase subunit